MCSCRSDSQARLQRSPASRRPLGRVHTFHGPLVDRVVLRDLGSNARAFTLQRCPLRLCVALPCEFVSPPLGFGGRHAIQVWLDEPLRLVGQGGELPQVCPHEIARVAPLCEVKRIDIVEAPGKRDGRTGRGASLVTQRARLAVSQVPDQDGKAEHEGPADEKDAHAPGGDRDQKREGEPAEAEPACEEARGPQARNVVQARSAGGKAPARCLLTCDPGLQLRRRRQFG